MTKKEKKQLYKRFKQFVSKYKDDYDLYACECLIKEVKRRGISYISEDTFAYWEKTFVEENNNV